MVKRREKSKKEQLKLTTEIIEKRSVFGRRRYCIPCV